MKSPSYEWFVRGSLRLRAQLSTSLTKRVINPSRAHTIGCDHRGGTDHLESLADTMHTPPQ